MSRYHQLVWSLLLAGVTTMSSAQEISVPRVDAMPDKPSPYFMRDWRQVAKGYDSLVYNFGLTGQYLPLISWNNNPENYPGPKSFRLHTVVGTTVPGNSEAINVLPSIIGATLAGIDKSAQNGNNWVLMSEDFFNVKSGELVYLNNDVANSGDDWWYDTMPNVFFYQLYWLYPGVGDSERQFVSVADRWLQALKSMGGSTTPWHLPNMDHRGWRLLTMTPNDIPENYHEPEAAGALAWLFYNAWMKTRDVKYRSAAELSMEFLNSYPSNPAYELQLSYGAYMAARMNAELGTTYDVQKIVNWCFDLSPIRSWGAMVGTWGGLDCSGLIGEMTSEREYAFLMNTFEQVGALVPLVRYDDRFARPIGKWVLSAANAARLFYPNFLPDQNQDSEEWSRIYDPKGYIGHEAMLKQSGSASPYATGDAISGGWGLTNLSLYSSSHVGILGGIIDTTNVPGILRLNLLKTDYYHDSAYASYLYYNPDSSAHSVQVEAGAGQHDLYDAVSKSFLKTNVSGPTTIDVPGKGAVALVLTPAGGAVTYRGSSMLINGVVVDYHSAAVPGNSPPRIKGLGALPDLVYPSHPSQLYCTALDPDGDTVSYAWSFSSGNIAGGGQQVSWTAPAATGIYAIGCSVTDGKGGIDSALVRIQVVDSTGPPPVIQRIYAHPGKVDLNATSVLTCVATDPSGYPLSFSWGATVGSVIGSDSTARWTAPGAAGNYWVRCTVNNGHGGQATDSVRLEVRDFRIVQSGDLVAYLPFNGNANDASGFNNNGTVNGATLVNDRRGNPGQAYSFNGASAWIKVTNSPSLNFDSSITVAFWMNLKAFYPTREQYPISHGNWQNRWKISISNQSNKLRWTVKTSNATRDLDASTSLALNMDYFVVAVYNGSDMELYLNGELDAFTSLSGLMAQTTYDLSIGRSLPAEATWSYNGVLDEVRIYDYALSYQDIQALYGGATGVKGDQAAALPQETALYQNYPNPFNPVTTIRYTVGGTGAWGAGNGVGTGTGKAGAGDWGLGARKTRLAVYDVLGREVAVLVNEKKTPGNYQAVFDASRLSSGIYFYRLTAGSAVSARIMILVK